MQSLFKECSTGMHTSKDWLCGLEDEKRVRKSDTAPAVQSVSLALRVGYAPGEESAGTRIGPFGQGDDIALQDLTQAREIECMDWRQELACAGKMGHGSHWPQEDERFRTRYNYWKAKVVVSDGADGFEEHAVLVQSAVLAKDRTMEVAQHSVDDAIGAGRLAHKFNAQTATLHAEEEGGDHDAESVVGVRVCLPVACFVLGGFAEDVGQPGQTILITKFPFPSVSKFVFDGKEEFSELPQAFFHYASWATGGQEVVADIQGAEDEDGDIFIVDPVVLRPAKATLLGALTNDGGEPREKARFECMHPKCGPLCKAFDPLRRGPHGGRRACGLAVPTCGVGGA